MKIKPDIRKLFDMIDVIYDREWLSNINNTESIELYYMYRGVYFNDKDIIKMNEYGLRHDITIIPPYMLGCEFVKTAGHYHQIASGTEVTFPEIYEVLSGKAQFLMQKPDGDAIQDIVTIYAEKGDKVLVPPGYGHITINISNDTLIVANWVAMNRESLYDPIRKKKGGAYFIIRDKDRIRMVKNSAYSYVPDIRILKPVDLGKIGIKKNENMYKLIDEADKLEFLTHPQKYEWLFDII